MDRQEIEEIVEQAVNEELCVLVESVINPGAGPHKGLLRVIVGASVIGTSVGSAECSKVAKRLSVLLDEEGYDAYFSGRYLLEVSTPGLTRKLQSDREMRFGIGRPVAIRFKSNLKLPNVAGTMKAFDAKTVDVEVEGETQTFERETIRKIQLDLL